MIINFYIKLKFLSFYHFNFIFLFNKIIKFLEHLYNFFNLDEIFFFIRQKSNLTINKFVEDPIYENLEFLKFSKSFFTYYPF